MTIQNVILLIAGVINLIMSVIIFSRGIKNKVNLYFSLLTFFNFLWAISLLLGRNTTIDFIWYEGGAILAYSAALGIAMSLYYFSVHFPALIIKKVRPIYNYIIVILGVILSIVPYINNVFILGYNKDIIRQEYNLFVNKPIYIVYSIYFISVVLLAVYNFYSKQKILEGIFKKRIRILLLTIIIGLVFGSYFDLFICYFANYEYSWLGPASTVFMNTYVFYLIFYTKNK